MNQDSAPLFEKLAAYAAEENTRWHVPGHQGAEELDDASDAWFRRIRRLDVTEVGELDDLHHPQGVIAEAQRLAAACFGAEETHFLVGGSTVGNQAMIVAAVSPGELLLVQRNVHKSIVHGLMLAGARAVFLSPEIDPATGLATGVKPAAIELALSAYPEAKAVLLSNPNYFGMADDLTEAAAVAHRHQLPLLVDEAHGAHYGFHPGVPPSALSCGADAVVQSTHKMLTSLTMGAMLHVQGGRIDRGRLKRTLGMLQSSSPSYPIMASLDLARRTAATQGHTLLDHVIARSTELRRWIEQRTALKPVVHTAHSSYASLDPLKLTLYDPSGVLSGFALRDALQEQGCYAEMADDRYVLLHLGLTTGNQELDRLKTALENISRSNSAKKQEMSSDIENIYIIPPDFQHSSPVSFDMTLLSLRNAEYVSPREAIGRCAAAMIIPYPPGIPVLYTGECITERTAVWIERLAAKGAVFQGLDDVGRNGIPVWTEVSREGCISNI